MKIVAIDRDEATRLEVISAFDQHWVGSTVWTARTAVEGVQLVADQHPDVVLISPDLPDMDVPDLCHEIHRRQDVPVVVVTEQGRVEDAMGGLDSGAADCIAQPVGPNELVARVWAVARRHRWNDDWRPATAPSSADV